MVFRTFWPSFILVIGLEKLWDWSLGADDALPTADLRFYPAAPVVPFQDNTEPGIGFAAGPARALDEDDGCSVGADPGGWNSCGRILLSLPLRSSWTG